MPAIITCTKTIFRLVSRARTPTYGTLILIAGICFALGVNFVANIAQMVLVAICTSMLAYHVANRTYIVHILMFHSVDDTLRLATMLALSNSIKRANIMHATVTTVITLTIGALIKKGSGTSAICAGFQFVAF